MPAESVSPSINPRRRLVLIVGLTLASWATMGAWLSLERPLLRWLGHEALVEPVLRAAILATWLLPLLFLPWLRDVGSLRLPRTWTVLLVLPFAFANLAGFYGLPSDQWDVLASIVGSALLIGAVEELIFRGYAFRGAPESHPRWVIAVSALCFALMHVGNLTTRAPDYVVMQIASAFIVGLGFGIIRLVSGSLGWCVLLHGLVDATSDLTISHVDGLRESLRVLFSATAVVATVVAFLQHPKLRSRAPTDQLEAVRVLSFARMTLLLLLAALLGALLDLAMESPRPTGFAAWIGGSLGSATVFFVAAMLVAIFLRGWRGFFAGLIIIALLTSVLVSSALQRRRESRTPPAASPPEGGPR